MEQINSVLFYIIALILIISSILVITSKRIINSVFFALICFLFFGFLFFMLNAPFNGVIQIAIYSIALSILFVIAVMLTDYQSENKATIKLSPKSLLIISGIGMIIVSVLYFLKETLKYDIYLNHYIFSNEIITASDNVKQLSLELLTHNIYSFELLGIYLLTALTGICILFVFKGGRQ